MHTKEIRNLLYDHPHRLNDEHVEYLLTYIDDLTESYNQLYEEHEQLRKSSRQYSQAMLGNMLDLVLNKPEIFTKE